MRTTCVLRALLIGAALLSASAPAVAHPLATTTVSIAVDAETLNLTLGADADALIAALEARAGAPVSGSMQTAADRRARLELLWPTLVAQIETRLNETPLVWRLQDVAIDEAAQTEMRFTAARPPGSRTLTWRNLLVAGSYPLAVRTLDGQ